MWWRGGGQTRGGPVGLLRRVVILWWRGGGGASDRVGAHAGAEKGLAVLRQLALANMSEGGLPVVVLCGERKEDMEEAVRVATRRKEDRLHPRDPRHLPHRQSILFLEEFVGAVACWALLEFPTTF